MKVAQIHLQESNNNLWIYRAYIYTMKFEWYEISVPKNMDIYLNDICSPAINNKDNATIDHVQLCWLLTYTLKEMSTECKLNFNFIAFVLVLQNNTPTRVQMQSLINLFAIKYNIHRKCNFTIIIIRHFSYKRTTNLFMRVRVQSVMFPSMEWINCLEMFIY